MPINRSTGGDSVIADPRDMRQLIREARLLRFQVRYAISYTAITYKPRRDYWRYIPLNQTEDDTQEEPQ